MTTEEKDREARRRYWEGDALAIAGKFNHDIRSPLGAISSSIDVIRDILNEENTDLSALAKGIETSSDQAMDLVAKVVGLLRVTYGEPAERESVPLAICIDAALGSNERARREAGAEIQKPKDWPVVYTVQDWIIRVFSQLISNAIRHGGKNIQLGWDELPGGVRCWVRDDGSGLPSAINQADLPAFETLHLLTTRTGLGLPTCRRILELLGSELSCLRTTDGHTEFSFFLVEDLPGQTPEETVLPTPHPLGRRSAAIAESYRGEFPATQMEFATTLRLVKRMLNVPIALVAIEGEEMIIDCDDHLPLREDLPSEFSSLVDRILSGGEPASEIRPENASMRLQSLYGTPLPGVDGEPIGCLGIAAEERREWSAEEREVIQEFARIAEKDLRLRLKRRRLADALRSAREDERLNASLLANSSDCIKLIDSEGRLIRINEPGLRLLEVEDENTVLGKPYCDLWPEEARGEVLRSMDEAMRGRTGRFQEFCPTAKGTPKWWDVAITAVNRDEGETPHLLSISRDITESKEAEIRLRESEQKFRLLANHMSQFAWIADANVDIFWYNQRWFDYTGSTLNEMKGQGWQTVIHPDHLSRVLAKVDHCFTAGILWEDTFPLRSREGEYRWFLSQAIPIRDGAGEVIQWFGTNTDITPQIEAENALRKASQAKDDFIAVLSHELRTPLNPVLLVASAAVEREDLPDDVRRDFETIRKNVETEARLIDDLLDMTRILRGRMPLILTTVTLDSLLAETIAALRNDAEAKEVELLTHFAPERLLLQGDEVRLQQILSNVIRNAIKFTPAAGKIELSTASHKDRLLITVIDTGLGMTESEIERIFDPFSQGDHAAERNAQRFGGLGLGLAISKLLVEQHGGTIGAKSPGLGLGSTIEIDLPLSAAVPSTIEGESIAPEAAAIEVKSAEEKSFRSMRILLIEDHDATRDTLAILLRRRGHTVVEASTIKEGGIAAADGNYDLLMSDIGLPDGRGDELMVILRKNGFDAPAIALSGYGMEADLLRSRKAGFGLHLTKPVSIQELDRALARIL